MSDLQIHINRAGQQYGPYPEATAREMLAAGQLLPTDLAWHPGAEGWKTLQELLGAEAAQASPAPPPPSNPAGLQDWTVEGELGKPVPPQLLVIPAKSSSLLLQGAKLNRSEATAQPPTSLVQSPQDRGRIAGQLG